MQQKRKRHINGSNSAETKVRTATETIGLAAKSEAPRNRIQDAAFLRWISGGRRQNEPVVRTPKVMVSGLPPLLPWLVASWPRYRAPCAAGSVPSTTHRTLLASYTGSGSAGHRVARYVSTGHARYRGGYQVEVSALDGVGKAHRVPPDMSALCASLMCQPYVSVLDVSQAHRVPATGAPFASSIPDTA
eukprot:2155313-Rhodomonas_salina.2